MMEYKLSFKINGVELIDDSNESICTVIEFLYQFRMWLGKRPPLPSTLKPLKPIEKPPVIHVTPTKRMCEGSYDLDDMLLALFGCAFMSVPALKCRMIERGFKPETKEGKAHAVLIRSLIRKYSEYVICEGRFVKLSQKGIEYTSNLKEAEK